MTADKAVIDTSVLAAMAFLEPQAEEANARLKGINLVAPPLLFFELAHICIKKIQQRPAEAEAIKRQFDDALTIPVEIVDVDYAGCVAVARTFKLSAYDASYLWLARMLNIELVTFDHDLGKAAVKSRSS